MPPCVCKFNISVDEQVKMRREREQASKAIDDETARNLVEAAAVPGRKHSQMTHSMAGALES